MWIFQASTWNISKEMVKAYKGRRNSAPGSRQPGWAGRAAQAALSVLSWADSTWDGGGARRCPDTDSRPRRRPR